MSGTRILKRRRRRRAQETGVVAPRMDASRRTAGEMDQRALAQSMGRRRRRPAYQAWRSAFHTPDAEEMLASAHRNGSLGRDIYRPARADVHRPDLPGPNSPIMQGRRVVSYKEAQYADLLLRDPRVQAKRAPRRRSDVRRRRGASRPDRRPVERVVAYVSQDTRGPATPDRFQPSFSHTLSDGGTALSESMASLSASSTLNGDSLFFAAPGNASPAPERVDSGATGDQTSLLSLMDALNRAVDAPASEPAPSVDDRHDDDRHVDDYDDYEEYYEYVYEVVDGDSGCEMTVVHRGSPGDEPGSVEHADEQRLWRSFRQGQSSVTVS